MSLIILIRSLRQWAFTVGWQWKMVVEVVGTDGHQAVTVGLCAESLHLNSASSLGILQGNYMHTAVEASRKRRDYFLWGPVENIWVELLILSELLNWIQTLHAESSPWHHQDGWIEGCFLRIIIPVISIILSKHKPFQCIPTVHNNTSILDLAQTGSNCFAEAILWMPRGPEFTSTHWRTPASESEH